MGADHPEIHAGIFPDLWNKRTPFLSGILAVFHPDVLLPMQNKRQSAVSAPAASDAAVPQAPGLQAIAQADCPCHIF